MAIPDFGKLVVPYTTLIKCSNACRIQTPRLSPLSRDSASYSLEDMNPYTDSYVARPCTYRAWPGYYSCLPKLALTWIPASKALPAILPAQSRCECDRSRPFRR